MLEIISITENPLSMMGKVAGVAYNARNPKRWRKIAERCLAEGHGRVSEFSEVTFEISGYSAKVVRELYTHIIGTSKVQASTRYIDYAKEGFSYIVPKSVLKDDEARRIWIEQMDNTNKAMLKLKELGIPTEDYTNLLPLAYDTTMVLKINVRALIHMFNVRSCTCAYWEFRQLMKDMKEKLKAVDEEWEFLCNNYFVPKCVASGYCEEETRTCKLRPTKSEIEANINLDKIGGSN